MPPTLIRVEPPELVFDVAGGNTKLNILNVTSQRIGYKLFSSHADVYVFEPSCGFIKPSGNVEVSVQLVHIPEKQGAEDHVTAVKARVAGENEVDRFKEWNTALPQDEVNFHVVRLKHRFETLREEMRAALRSIEKRMKDLTIICRLTLLAVCIECLLIISSVGQQ